MIPNTPRSSSFKFEHCPHPCLMIFPEVTIVPACLQDRNLRSTWSILQIGFDEEVEEHPYTFDITHFSIRFEGLTLSRELRYLLGSTEVNVLIVEKLDTVPEIWEGIEELLKGCRRNGRSFYLLSFLIINTLIVPGPSTSTVTTVQPCIISITRSSSLLVGHTSPVMSHSCSYCSYVDMGTSPVSTLSSYS